MKFDAESQNNGYSDAHKAEKDKYVDLATVQVNREDYDEAWTTLCHIRDHLSSDYRETEVNGLFAMCDFHLSQQEEEELRNTIESAQKDVKEKNYSRAKMTLELYKKSNPGEEKEEIDCLLDLCERVLRTPPDRPYLEVLDLDSVDDDGTTAIVARMVKGSLSAEDTLVHHGTGRSYNVDRFRIVEDSGDYNHNANDPGAYLTEVDAETERRPFVFFVKDEFYEINPEDWFYKG